MAEAVCRAAALLTAQGIAARPLYKAAAPLSPTTLRALVGAGVAVETACPSVIDQGREAGLTERQLFLHFDGQPSETLAAFCGHVRFLAATPEALAALDGALDGALPAGHFAPVGVYLAPDAPFWDVPALAAMLRRTRNLTLRHAVLCLDGADDPAAAAVEAFSYVKRLRADVPCMLHSFRLDGLLPPLLGGDTALIGALRMLSALNESSLYAEFYLG